MNTTLDRLNSANPGIDILPVDSDAFLRYGRVIDTVNVEEMIARANAILPTSEGVVYEGSVEALEEPLAFIDVVEQQVYGGMPIQVGWCYGRNTRMDALEYHKGVEVVVCLTDAILLVGDLRDVSFGDEITYDSTKVEAFYAPAGAVVESSAWCLHFAPIHTTVDGQFATLVILPRGTNERLPFKPEPTGEARLLFGVNKWLIAHPDAEGLAKFGAYVGIQGPNVVINPI